MATLFGTLATAIAAATQTDVSYAQGQLGGKLVVFVADAFEGDAAQNDLLFLGAIPSNARLDPVLSVIAFDDLGTSVTMDVGDTTDEDALVAAQDVATAAGQISLLKSVDIANWGKPLWAMLGHASDPGGKIDLYAKFEAANPAAGSLAWRIVGTVEGA